MKGVNSVPSAIPAPPRNVTHAPLKKNAAAQKCPPQAGTRNAHRPASAEILAPFAQLETRPANAQTWHHHQVLWFQPERAPAKPAWTELSTERRNRIPRPDFSPLETVAPDRPHRLQNLREALQPGSHPRFPDSDLEPLGWDPRALCRREDK